MPNYIPVKHLGQKLVGALVGHPGAEGSAAVNLLYFDPDFVSFTTDVPLEANEQVAMHLTLKLGDETIEVPMVKGKVRYVKSNNGERRCTVVFDYHEGDEASRDAIRYQLKTLANFLLGHRQKIIRRP